MVLRRSTELLAILAIWSFAAGGCGSNRTESVVPKAELTHRTTPAFCSGDWRRLRYDQMQTCRIALKCDFARLYRPDSTVDVYVKGWVNLLGPGIEGGIRHKATTVSSIAAQLENADRTSMVACQQWAACNIGLGAPGSGRCDPYYDEFKQAQARAQRIIDRLFEIGPPPQ